MFILLLFLKYRGSCFRCYSIMSIMIRHGVWSDCYLSADYLFIYFQNINSNTFVYYRLPALFFSFPSSIKFLILVRSHLLHFPKAWLSCLLCSTIDSSLLRIGRRKMLFVLWRLTVREKKDKDESGGDDEVCGIY